MGRHCRNRIKRGLLEYLGITSNGWLGKIIPALAALTLKLINFSTSTKLVNRSILSREPATITKIQFEDAMWLLQYGEVDLLQLKNHTYFKKINAKPWCDFFGANRDSSGFETQEDETIAKNMTL